MTAKILLETGEEADIPMKTASGKVIYEVDKILRGIETDKRQQQAQIEAVEAVMTALRPYLKGKDMVAVPVAERVSHAMNSAFADGKISYAQLLEHAPKQQPSPETTEHNNRVAVKVFAYLVDAPKIKDQHLADMLTDADYVFGMLAFAPIQRAVQDFLSQSTAK